MSPDKRAAYQTLQHCLAVVAQAISPIAPFFADWLYRNLTEHCRAESIERSTPFRHPSIHLTDWAPVEAAWIDPELEERMALAMDIASLGHGIRKKERIKVRQPLSKLLVAVRDVHHRSQLQAVEELIKAELNVKEVEYLSGASDVLVKTVKPNFKVLGPKLGAQLKAFGAAVAQLDSAAIAELERSGRYTLPLNGENIELTREDVEIRTQDIPGWSVSSSALSTVALDLHLTDALIQEGRVRELISRIQQLRKDLGFEVTDRITLQLQPHPIWNDAVRTHEHYLCAEVLATHLEWITAGIGAHEIELDGVTATLTLQRSPQTNSPTPFEHG